MEFEISSTQVSITPDKRQVYISMNVEEGDKYTIDEVNLLGELNDVKPEELRALLLVEPGQVFSQAWLTATEERLEAALGNAGYTFASAGGIPVSRKAARSPSMWWWTPAKGPMCAVSTLPAIG